MITNWPPNLRRAEAARYLTEVHGIPVQPTTLSKWFCVSSDGPPAFKAGRIPLYPRDQLDAWAIKLSVVRTFETDRVYVEERMRRIC